MIATVEWYYLYIRSLIFLSLRNCFLATKYIWFEKVCWKFILVSSWFPWLSYNCSCNLGITQIVHPVNNSRIVFKIIDLHFSHTRVVRDDVYRLPHCSKKKKYILYYNYNNLVRIPRLFSIWLADLFLRVICVSVHRHIHWQFETKASLTEKRQGLQTWLMYIIVV